MTPRFRALTSALVVGLALAGCLERELTPVNPCAQQGTDQSVQINNVDKVDLLFLIDNSGSMEEEQRALREELPQLVQVLATGDLEFGNPDDPQAGIQDFTPVRDLHVGVITSDMGTGGFDQMTCDEPVFGDDGVLQFRGNPANVPCLTDPTLPECDGPEPGLPCQPEYDRFLSFENPDGQVCQNDPESCTEFANDFSCIAAVGFDGCGFEQQLEAILKALIPADPSCTEPFCNFFMGTSGQGNNPSTNGGFLRPDSLLAILVLTDEEDCSAADVDLFNRDSSRYIGNLNLRCTENTGALHPLERYVDGLLSLRRDPSLLIFSVIAGVPTQLVRNATNDETGLQDFNAILSDNLMVPRPNLDRTGLVPSCTSANGSADPPRRFVQLARDLQARGAGAVVQSICQPDFRPAIDSVLEEVARVLGEACLPRPLNPDASGRVNCNVIEILPPDGDMTECSQVPGRTRVGVQVDPITNEESEICSVAQIPASNDEVPNIDEVGAGWFYDDFSTDALTNCREGQNQRISYIPGAEPVTNTVVRLQCLQPVQGSADSDAAGGGTTVALGSPCRPFPSSQPDPVENICQGVTTDGFTNANICDPFSRTCQAPCETSADCGAGFLCDTGRAELRDQSTPIIAGGIPDEGGCAGGTTQNDDEGVCFRCAPPYEPLIEEGTSFCVRTCSAAADCAADGVEAACLEAGFCALPTTCIDPTCSG